jgi:hypothetical protein
MALVSFSVLWLLCSFPFFFFFFFLDFRSPTIYLSRSLFSNLSGQRKQKKWQKGAACMGTGRMKRKGAITVA